jgi:hypothetical protein
MTTDLTSAYARLLFIRSEKPTRRAKTGASAAKRAARCVGNQPMLGRRIVVNQSVNYISGSPDFPRRRNHFSRPAIYHRKSAPAPARAGRAFLSVSHTRDRVQRTEKSRRRPEEFAPCFIIDFVGDINSPRVYQSPKFFLPRDRRDCDSIDS